MKDVEEFGPSGEVIVARLGELSKRTADDIKACASACDMYNNKHILIKVLKGPIWEDTLTKWAETFTTRKREFEFALTIHSARAIDTVKITVEAVDAK